MTKSASSSEHINRTDGGQLAHLAEVASAAGLTLLTPHWINAHAKYLFRCQHGHEFERHATAVKRGLSSCKLCKKAIVRQRFLDQLALRDLVCLEGDYLGSKVRQHFECARGHRWDTEARKILEGSGCPACANAQTAALNRHQDGLERLHQAAAERSGRCLAEAYAGIAAIYEWECASGHRWRAAGSSIVRGNWCRVCFGLRHSERMTDPDGLVRLQAVAASHGGQCLDSEYRGVNEKYGFRCAAGHEWRQSGTGVLVGRWCSRCAAKRIGEEQRVPDGLDQLKMVAASHGGELLDAVYAGINASYTFRCARGHEWQTKGGHVLRDGTWCRACAGLRRRHTIESMQEIAKARGGLCLSPEYLGVKAPLLWECHRGHQWKIAPDSVINAGHWCASCAVLDRIQAKNRHKRKRYLAEGRLKTQGHDS